MPILTICKDYWCIWETRLTCVSTETTTFGFVTLAYFVELLQIRTGRQGRTSGDCCSRFFRSHAFQLPNQQCQNASVQKVDHLDANQYLFLLLLLLLLVFFDFFVVVKDTSLLTAVL